MMPHDLRIRMRKCEGLPFTVACHVCAREHDFRVPHWSRSIGPHYCLCGCGLSVREAMEKAMPEADA